MDSLSAASDLPRSDSGDICALLERRVYTVNNLVVSPEGYPKFIEAGGYKLDILVRDANGVITTGVKLICKLL